jgi:hypothetical protein
MIWATCSWPPYFSVTYLITSPRPWTEKSMSTSGMLILSGFKNRSKRSEYSRGSRSVISSAYATIDPAADPRPGPTAIFLSLAYLTKSHTMRK